LRSESDRIPVGLDCRFVVAKGLQDSSLVVVGRCQHRVQRESSILGPQRIIGPPEAEERRAVIGPHLGAAVRAGEESLEERGCFRVPPVLDRRKRLPAMGG
jgi:hypothetical protein